MDRELIVALFRKTVRLLVESVLGQNPSSVVIWRADIYSGVFLS